MSGHRHVCGNRNTEGCGVVVVVFVRFVCAGCLDEGSFLEIAALGCVEGVEFVVRRGVQEGRF